MLDADASLRLMSDGLGAPNKALRDEKAVAAVRKARQEQEAQAAEQAQAQQMQTMAADAQFKRAAQV